MLKAKITVKITSVLVFILLAGGSQAVKAQNENSAREIELLVNEFHSAETTRNIEKFENLLTDDFQETRTDGRETVTKPKAGKIFDLRGGDMPEALNEILPMIETYRGIADFSSAPAGDKTNFKYQLTERSSLKIHRENPPVEFTKTERFDVAGTAIRRNGKWFLDSLQKKFKPSENKADAQNELTEAIKYDLGLLALLVEAKNKELKQEPRKDIQTMPVIFEFYNLVLNPKIEIPAKLKNVSPVKNAGRALQIAPEWLQKLAAKIEKLTTEIEMMYEPRIAPRLTSHKFRGQTVYQLKSTLADVLYDQKGDVLCVLLIEIKSLTAEKCSDFDAERNKGKLVWQMAEEKK